MSQSGGEQEMNHLLSAQDQQPVGDDASQDQKDPQQAGHDRQTSQDRPEDAFLSEMCEVYDTENGPSMAPVPIQGELHNSASRHSVSVLPSDSQELMIIEIEEQALGDAMQQAQSLNNRPSTEAAKEKQHAAKQKIEASSASNLSSTFLGASKLSLLSSGQLSELKSSQNDSYVVDVPEEMEEEAEAEAREQVEGRGAKREKRRTQTNDLTKQGLWRRHWKKVLLHLGLFLTLLGLITTASLLWPRSINVTARSVARADDNHYMLSTIYRQLTVNMTNEISAVLDNQNFVGVWIKAQVKTKWGIVGGLGAMAVKSAVEKSSDFYLPPRSKKELRLPFVIDYTGDPKSDPMYVDFLTRCTDPDERKRKVDLQYIVDTRFSYLGWPKQFTRAYDYQIACPFSTDQIADILRTVKVNLSEMKSQDLANTLRALVEPDSE